MELAVVDSFARTDASKAGTRASETPSVSFSDVLDASSRRAEPAPRPRDNGEPAANARADDARPAKTEEAKPEAPRTSARAKSKSESAEHSTDAASTDEPTEAAADESGEAEMPAATPAPETAAAPEGKGKGAAALDLIAALLASGESAIDPTTPKGQIVAAIVVPQNVPEHAAAAGNHIVPGLVTSPAPAQPATPAPTGAAPIPTSEPAPPQPAATEPTAFTPAPAANTNAPAAQPAPSVAPTAEAPDLAVASAPAPVANPTAAPAVPAPAQPAAIQVVAAETATAAAAPATLPLDALVAEVSDDTEIPVLDLAVSDDVPLPLTGTTTPTSARPTISQAPSSGYVAQMVSQETANADAPDAVPTPVTDEAFAVAPRTAEPAPADLAAAGDDVAAAPKPAEHLTVATTETGVSRETHAADSTAAARGARPPAVPLPEQVVVRIAKAMADGVDRINVKLSPAELGQIDVRMEIGPDGRFQAVFAADRPQTVELLQRDARELARALQDAGLRADTGSLSFNLRGQGQQGNPDSTPSRTGSLPLAAGGDDLPSEMAPLPLYRSTGLGAGRVDIRV